MFKRKKEEVYQKEFAGIRVQIHRKRIKNLYVRVNRRTGEVRISCPIRFSELALERFIDSKYVWIKKQQQKAASNPPKPEYQLIDGERIFILGNEYELMVESSKRKSIVQVDGNKMILQLRGESNLEKRKKVLDTWMRAQLMVQIPILIDKYEADMEVHVKDYRVKKMKTRWGTCNITDQRIWLNLELAKKSYGCLEMVVVHEMVHLLERLHNKRFYALMDKFMPDWRIYNQELNSTID